MRKSYILRGIILVIGLLLFGGAIYYANYDLISERNSETFSEFETARVLEVLEDNTFVADNDSGTLLGNMVLRLEIASGRYQGEVVEMTYHLVGLANAHVSAGDSISVRINTIDGELSHVTFNTVERRGTLTILIFAFLATLALIGGKKGLMSVIGLIFTLGSIIFLLVPLMIKGYPVVLTTIAILTLVTIVTLVLIGGITAKSITAMLGCLVGVLSATVIASLVGELTFISGYHMEEVDVLLITASANDFSVQVSGLFISGILIATLGAVMDTAVSIASSMEEVKLANPGISANQLFKSGMNVGRDMMGTMSNTLILAFAGAGLNMIMIIYMIDNSFNQIINSDFIAVEVIRGVAGSLGIILTVPAVAFIGSRLFTKYKI